MALASAAAVELKVAKILEGPNAICVLGSDLDGCRLKIVLYPPASVVLHSRLCVDGVYRLIPAPL